MPLGPKEDVERDSSLNSLCKWSIFPLCETVAPRRLSGDAGRTDIFSRMTVYASWWFGFAGLLSMLEA